MLLTDIRIDFEVCLSTTNNKLQFVDNKEELPCVRLLTPDRIN
jgi:hypothetical protein